MSAINAMKTFAVPKSSVAFMITSLWQYPEQYRDTLSRYYKVYWSSRYYQGLFNLGQLYNPKDDMMYYVIYNKCTPTDIKHATQVELSFREAQPEYELQAYVLVRPAYGHA